MTTLKVKKISLNAHIPQRNSEYAAGLDLYSISKYIIPPFEKRLINTNLKISIPEGYYGRIAPKSGLANKYFIDIGAGVIDSDYRGEIKILVFNFRNKYFKIKPNMAIAQLIIEKICLPIIKEVEDLEETERGENGFGSTTI